MKCGRELCQTEADPGRFYCSRSCAQRDLDSDQDSSSLIASTLDRERFSFREAGAQLVKSCVEKRHNPSDMQSEESFTLQSKKRQSEPKSSNTILPTKPKLHFEQRSDEKTSPKTSDLPTQEQAGNARNGIMNEQEHSGGIGMQGTVMTTAQRSEREGDDAISPMASLTSQKSLNEERSHTMSLIDESANVLLSCMKSASRHKGGESIIDFRQVNAVANIGKQIASLAKVKLEAIKAAQ